MRVEHAGVTEAGRDRHGRADLKRVDGSSDCPDRWRDVFNVRRSARRTDQATPVPYRECDRIAAGAVVGVDVVRRGARGVRGAVAEVPVISELIAVRIRGRGPVERYGRSFISRVGAGGVRYR